MNKQFQCYIAECGIKLTAYKTNKAFKKHMKKMHPNDWAEKEFGTELRCSYESLIKERKERWEFSQVIKQN